MKTYSIDTVIAHARSLSGYYRKLYAGVKETAPALESLPMVEQKSFWLSNATGEGNNVLTEPVRDGIIFKSGGTTGNPKHSYYSRAEWDAMTGWFGRFQERNGFSNGDMVANLFYAGELYSSFLFLHESFRCGPVDLTILPLAGNASFELIAKTMLDFGGNAMVGVPTTMVSFAEYVQNKKINGLHIERIRFGGETLYEDQREFLQAVFPDASIASIGYASVDGGLLGFCDESCGFNEHRPFDGHNIIEFIDEKTGDSIDEVGLPGIMLTTNLSRLLMPIIRYPVGDYGVWVDPPGTPFRRYKILARTESGARVGTVSLYPDDVHNVLNKYVPGTFRDFQLVIEHFEGKDRLTIRLGSGELPANSEKLAVTATQGLLSDREHLLHEEQAGHVHPTKAEWVFLNELERNPRTGKLIRILDKRFD